MLLLFCTLPCCQFGCNCLSWQLLRTDRTAWQSTMTAAGVHGMVVFAGLPIIRATMGLSSPLLVFPLPRQQRVPSWQRRIPPLHRAHQFN